MGFGTMGANWNRRLCQWPSTVEDLIPFEKLSKFRKVSRGAFGCIYKAVMEGRDGYVALKVLAVSEDTATELFMQEAAILKQLAHEGIVDYIGLCNVPKGQKGISEANTSSRLALIEEFVEGETLSHILMEQTAQPFQKKYSLSKALNWMIDVAESLDYLHRCQPTVVHRDITPNNIMVRGNSKKRGRVTLVDFGLAVLVDNFGFKLPKLNWQWLTAASRLVNTPRATNSCRVDVVDHSELSLGVPDQCAGIYDVHNGMYQNGCKWLDDGFSEKEQGGVVDESHRILTGQTGSFLFMAPEVFKNKAYDQSADIFSFGSVMYETFCRKVLLVAETNLDSPIEAKEFAARVAYGYRPPIPPTLRQDLRDLIQECWNDNPRDRPTAGAILEKLKSIKVAMEVVEECSAPSWKLWCFRLWA